MKVKRFVSVLLTIILITAMFIPAGLAEGEEGSDPPESTPVATPEPIVASDAVSAPVTFSVEFQDWDGTRIGDVQTVVQGENAVEPTHPNRDGYSPDGWDKDFNNVQSDLVVIAKYKALETYTLTINYLFQDNGVAAQPYIATIKAGGSLPYSVASPAVAGYTPDQASVSGTLNGSDATMTVIYYPSPTTPYTVKYFTENLDGTAYSLYRTDSLSGSTGAAVSANSISIDGFTAPATMPSGRISADGKMVLEAYYSRNTYTVYFVTNGTYIDPVSYKFGATVAAWPATAVRDGYTFIGWDTTKPTTMPSHDITVTARWTAKTVNYTLVYWLENISSTGYDYVGASTRSGQTGTAPTIPSSVPSGVSFPIGSSYYTYDSTKTTAEKPASILGDGTTIVNVYYSRNSYTITFNLQDGTMAIGGITYNNSNPYTITAKYGAYIGDKWPGVSPTKSGTTFTGWKKSTGGGGGTTYVTRQYYMDTDLSGATLNAQYDSAKAVTIYYYFENLSGNTSGKSLGGKYYTENTAYRQTVNTSNDTDGWSAKTFDGFTILSGYSSVDLVNNTATFYYTRNSYNLSFYSNGSLVSSTSYQYGAPISAAADPTNGSAGNSFAGWFSNQSGYGESYTFGSMPAYNLILYAKWVPIVYTVTFDSQGGSAVPAQQVSNGEQATQPATPTWAGYNFSYWYLSGESARFVFDRQIHGNITLLAKWIPSTDISYTVKYVDTGNAQLHTPLVINGQTMGSTVYAQAEVVEHFLPDAVSKSLTLGASANAIVFTYTPFTSVNYTVRHVATDGSFDTSSTVSTGKSVVTANYENHPGYSPDAYQKTLKLSINPADNVITFYYSKNADKFYTIKHYKQNLGTTGYTLADTESLTGPVGYRATATPKSYTGFAYNSGISNATGTITSDGSLVLNLYYDRVTYALSYNANGGSGTMASQSGKYESSVNVASNGFARDNYIFTGWKTSGGTPYSAGDSLTLTGNVVLFAQWQEKAKYIVTYDNNGGTGTMNDGHSPYYDGTSFTVMANTFGAPANKHFVGWNDDRNGGGTAYAAGSSYSVSGNVTLYAQWAYNNQYTVTYYGNGGTGSTTDPHGSYYDGNEVTTMSNSFANFGYNFVKWNTKADGKGTDYAAGAKFNIEKDMELYAQWEKDASLWYHVTYDGNGSTTGVPTDTTEYVKNTPVTVKADKPTLANAVFLGWSTTQHALITSQTAAAAVAYVSSPFDIQSNTTLYAVWAEDKNGPNGIPDTVPDYLQFGLVYNGNGETSGVVPVNSNIYDPGAYVSVQGNMGSLARDNAVFLGWSDTSAALIAKAADVPTPLYTDSSSIMMLSGGITLYAVWAEDKNGPEGKPDKIPDYLEFSVTYEANSTAATGSVTDAHIYPDNFEVTVQNNSFALTNYVFDHWNTLPNNSGTSAVGGDKFNIHSNTTFNAIWELDANGPGGGPDEIPDKIEHGITYDANGGDAASVPTDSHIYPKDYSALVQFTPVPTRSGYDFLGWDETATATVPTYTASGIKTYTMGESNVKLYAIWSLHAYSITYNMNEGTNNAANPTTYTIEDDEIALQAPTKQWYTFLGWTDAAHTTPTLNLTIPAHSTGDRTVTANWQEYAKYTVTYDANGGFGIMSDSHNPYYDTASFTVLANTFTAPANKHFVGWNTDPEGAGIAYAIETSYTISGNVKLYAQWAFNNQYTVTYYGNGGTGSTTDLLSPYYDGNEVTTLSNSFANFGYNFVKWNTKADGSGTDYLAGAKFNIEKDMELYAQWEKDASLWYHVTYDGNGSTTGVPTDTTEYLKNTPVTVKADKPTLANAVFLGWSTTQHALITSQTAAAAVAYVSSPFDIQSNTTLYAVWAEDKNGPGGFYDGIPDYLEFSVTYDANGTGATGSVTDGNIYPDGYTVTVKDNAFVRTNYLFQHWNTQADGLGDNAAEGSTFGIHSNTTFNAIWELDANGPGGGPDEIPDKIEHGITYDANGGDVTSVPTDSHIYPKDYSALVQFTPVPTRSGYDFLGWDESSVAVTPAYTSTGTTALMMGESNVKLYAIWSPHTYGITYELNNGTVAGTNPSTYTVISDDITLINPTRPGYAFLGWTSTDLAEPTLEVKILKGTTGEKVFTAVWSDPIEYKINYILYGGTNNADNPTKYTVESPAITLKNPTKSGYDFLGWEPGDAITAGSTGEKTFTAKWSDPIAYDITYVLDGGTNSGDNPTKYTVESPTITLKAPTKEGYNFLGWDPGNTIESGSTGAKTFTAKWSDAIGYEITYNLDGGTVSGTNPTSYTVESDGITLINPTKAGSTFLGWTGAGLTGTTMSVTIPKGSTGNRAYTAMWSVNTFAVRFFAVDGVTQIGSTQTVNWGSAATLETAPARTGYAFDTWVLTGDDGSVTTDLRNVKENIDAVASYIQNGYTVTFVDYNGTVLGTDGVLYGQAATAPDDPTREGYTFTGWSVPFGNVTRNLTVTAQYEINTYTVTFVDYDGTVLSTQTVDWNTAAKAPADPTRDGYTFIGWDLPFDKVTSELKVTATYQAVTVAAPDEAVPQTGNNDTNTVTEEPVPESGPQQDLNWMWWLLLIPLLLLLLLLLLLYNVTVAVYGVDEKGQEKLLRTIRKLKRKKDEVIVSLKKSQVRGGVYGVVELTKPFTKRMRGNRLTVDVEGTDVLSVVVPDDAEDRFQARINKWIVL